MSRFNDYGNHGGRRLFDGSSTDDTPPSTNGEGVKALWKRKMRGSDDTYADFLDGRGIVKWLPQHRNADDDGWLRNDDNYDRAGLGRTNQWPTYNNEQDGGGGLLVHYYCGGETNIRLSPKQTAKWNEYYGYTPPLSEEEQREQELAALTPRQRKIEELTDLMHKEVKRLSLLKIEEERLAKAYAFQQQQVRASVEMVQQIHDLLVQHRREELKE